MQSKSRSCIVLTLILSKVATVSFTIKITMATKDIKLLWCLKSLHWSAFSQYLLCPIVTWEDWIGGVTSLPTSSFSPQNVAFLRPYSTWAKRKYKKAPTIDFSSFGKLFSRHPSRVGTQGFMLSCPAKGNGSIYLSVTLIKTAQLHIRRDSRLVLYIHTAFWKCWGI